MTDVAERSPESAALAAYLREWRVDAELLAPGADTSTVPAAAAALGVPERQIVKSLLFEGKGGALVLVIARGTARVDRQKLSAVTGLRQPRLASPEVVRRATGFLPGGMPPVGHASPLRVVLDRRVLDEPVVFGGGGRSDTMLRIRPQDIARLTRATVADVADEAAP